jgi:hypothetical protein
MQIQISTTDSNTSDFKVEVEGKTYEVHFEGEMSFTVSEECVYFDRWGDKYETNIRFDGEFEACGVWGNCIEDGEIVEQVYAGEVHAQLVEAFAKYALDVSEWLEAMASERL